MDISKILFDKLGTEKIALSFNSLDINDGTDLALTTDKDSQSQIVPLLNSMDEESTLVPAVQGLDLSNAYSKSISTANLLLLEELLFTKQENKEKLEEELEKKQEEYEVIIAEINDNQESTNSSSLKDRAEDLFSQISSLNLKIENIQNEILTLKIQYASEEAVVNTQKAVAQKIGASQVESTAKVRAESVSTPEITETISSDNIDWSQLSLEGKGINIANMAKLIYESYENTGVKSPLDAYNNILYNGSTEEREALIKLVSYPTTNTSYKQEKKFTSLFSRPNMSSEAAVLSRLATLDTDGDGFLSDDEISQIKNNKYKSHSYGIKEDGSLGSCGDCAAHFRNYSVTTVNGEKCYCVGGYHGSIILTEDEYKALDKYYNENGRSASYQGALEAMGITETGTYSKSTSSKTSKDFCLFEGESGMTSRIYSGVTTQKRHTENQDKYLWYAYMALKYRIG